MKSLASNSMASTFALPSQEAQSQRGRVFFHSRNNSSVMSSLYQSRTGANSPEAGLPPLQNALSHRSSIQSIASVARNEPKKGKRRMNIASSQRMLHRNGILSYAGIIPGKKPVPAKMSPEDRLEFLFQLIQDCYAAPQKSQIYQKMMEFMKLVVPMVHFPYFKAAVRKGIIHNPEEIGLLVKHLEFSGDLKKSVTQKITDRREDYAIIGTPHFSKN